MPIPTATILVIGSTLTGAAIGAVIPEWIRTRTRRRNLRIALKSEMTEMHPLIELDAETLPDPAITDFISTTVYQSNAGSIGLLSSEEVTAIVRFYSAVFWFQSELQIFEAAGDDKQAIGEHIETLDALRKDALDAIEQNV